MDIAKYVIIILSPTKSDTRFQLSEFCCLKIRCVLHYVGMTFPSFIDNKFDCDCSLNGIGGIQHF